MAQTGKQAPKPATTKQTPEADSEETAQPKSKKTLYIIVGLVVFLLVNGGAVWYLNKNGSNADSKKTKKNTAAIVLQPKFIALEPFTVNLQRETTDQFLQVGISLKFFEPELEERLKVNLPEIRHRILLLLSSKHASELSSVEGKNKLAQEIITVTDGVLGIAPPPKLSNASAVQAASAPAGIPVGTADENADEETTDEEGAAVEEENKTSRGIDDVMFTSFIIQ